MSPTSGATIAITAVERRIVLALLKEHLPDTTAWVYGSRVAGTARANSDLDLVVFTTPEQMRQVGELRDAFEESNLPFRVDLFVWDAVPENYRAQIRRRHAVLVNQTRSPRDHAPDEWRQLPLGECATINDSTYSPRENWPYINYLDTGNITRNRITTIAHLQAGKDKYPSRARRKCIPGDIVYSTVRPNQRHFGRLRDIPGNFLASTGFAVVRAISSTADAAFLYWFLTQDQIVEYLHSIADNSTSAYPSIKPRDLEQLMVRLPQLDQQRAIAHILGTLDDKIALNRSRNETLEAMAQAIFRDWFVDFGPVRAKMEDRAPYLPPELWKLFPTHLTNSTLGSVPDGWDIKPLGEGYDLTMGQSPPGISYNEAGEGLPFFQGCTDFGFRYPKNRRFCSAPARTARAEDTLVSVRAPVGDMNLAWEKCCIGRGVAALRHESDSPSFTYYSVQAMRPEIRQFEHTGTVFGAITRKQFEGLSALNPPGVLISAYDGLVSGIDEQIRLNTSESRALAFARDTLLPRLISGKIRPSSAKAFLAELP